MELSVDIFTFLTRSSSIAGQTKADKGVDLIDAGPSVLAWIGLAVVNVWRGRKARREGAARLNTHTHGHTQLLLCRSLLVGKKPLRDQNFWRD